MPQKACAVNALRASDSVMDSFSFADSGYSVGGGCIFGKQRRGDRHESAPPIGQEPSISTAVGSRLIQAATSPLCLVAGGPPFSDLPNTYNPCQS